MKERADYKQCAILVIHGIGEQKQSETIRSFVRGLVGDDFIYSPVAVNEEKFSYKLTHFSGAKSTRFDFFEYYWASNFRDTNYFHVLAWLKEIFSKKDVPFKLFTISFIVNFIKGYFSSLILLVIFVVFILPFISDEWTLEKIFGVINILAAIGSFLLFIIRKPILNIIGDVARYLYNSPNNVDSREKVKAEGVQFLKQIHEQKNEDGSPKYARVIVVGHSLGSIIGFHMLSTFWAEKSNEFNFPQENQNALEVQLKKYNQIAEQLVKAAQNRSKDIQIKPNYTRTLFIGMIVTSVRLFIAIRKNRNAFFFPLQNEQLTRDYHQLQQDLQAVPAVKERWRISDFITLGSPLHYSDFLLANDKKDWKNRIQQREISICPPVPIDASKAYQVEYLEKDQLRFHHAAVFSIVKWSNVYFRGDLIAGELNHQLGQGIMEYEVELKKGKKLLHQSLKSHTKYWDRAKDLQNEAVQLLKKIIGV